MTSNTRIQPAPMHRCLRRVVKRFSKKMFGEVPESLGVTVAQPAGAQDLPRPRPASRQKWNACDEDLKSFAHMAVAALIGCSFCLDLGYFLAHNEGLDEAKAREVPRWRESDVFTPLERDVMEYAEAMSQTPPTVTDELSARLLEQLGAPALVELTAWVALANMSARSEHRPRHRVRGVRGRVRPAALAQPSAVASPA